MTDLRLTRDEADLAAEARAVFASLLAPHRLAADDMAGIPPAVLAHDDIGRVARAFLPRRFDGGWRFLSATRPLAALNERPLLRVLVAEEAGRADAPLFAALPGPGLAGPVVEALGSPAQQHEFFSDFAAAPLRWGAFALSEPQAGSDMTAIATTAARVAGGYRLNGRKYFVGCGERASWLVVFATVRPGTGRFGMRCFLVPGDAPGMTRRALPSIGFRALGLSAIDFDDCFVPNARRLAAVRGADAVAGAQRAFEYYRPMVAALGVGLAGAALAEAWTLCRRAGTRSSAPAWRRLRWDLEDARVRVRAVRLLVRHCAWRQAQGRDATAEASMAKVQAAIVAREVSGHALRVAGAVGVPDHPGFAKSLRDARAFDLLEGTGEIHRLIVVRALVARLRESQAPARAAEAVPAVATSVEEGRP